MPPIDFTTADYDFFGETQDFPGHLSEEFQLHEDNILALDEAMAAGNLALHGTGRESGCGLTVGSGLSCVIGTGYYWVGGRRYQIASAIIVALPISATRHIYLDAAGTTSLYSAKQNANPAGTWYVGQATCNGTECSSVDDSSADTVASNAGLDDRVTQAEADITSLGLEVDDHEDRIVNLESGGGGGSGDGGPAFWGGLDKSLADPTSIDQEILADLAQHVTDYHGATPGGGGTELTINLEEWDKDAANGMRSTLKLCRSVDQDLPGYLLDVITVVWNVYGDGSGETPDFIDRINSTWLPG